MLGISLFVFSADPVDCGNNLFYRFGPPPAAARAEGVDQAKIFMNALSATITSSSVLPKLAGYTVLAGQTLFAADNTTILGSVLQVSGWRVFVAKTRLEAVTKTMVDSLLGMFAQAKTAYEKLSGSTADQTVADGTLADKNKVGGDAVANSKLEDKNDVAPSKLPTPGIVKAAALFSGSKITGSDGKEWQVICCTEQPEFPPFSHGYNVSSIPDLNLEGENVQAGVTTDDKSHFTYLIDVLCHKDERDETNNKVEKFLLYRTLVDEEQAKIPAKIEKIERSCFDIIIQKATTHQTAQREKKEKKQRASELVQSTRATVVTSQKTADDAARDVETKKRAANSAVTDAKTKQTAANASRTARQPKNKSSQEKSDQAASAAADLLVQQTAQDLVVAKALAEKTKRELEDALTNARQAEEALQKL